MSSWDSPDINASHSGSRLLSLDSPKFSSDSHTGPGGPDLSVSELSLSDPDSILNKPFSLLARFNPKQPSPQPQPQESKSQSEDLATPTRANWRPEPISKDAEEDAEEDEHPNRDAEVEDEEVVRQRAQERRDEKLKNDIFILKKLNAAFERFHDALEETSSANERVASQIAETDALLNKYIDILSKSEEFSRLIFDEKWHGAEADEQEYIRQKSEEAEQARQAAEELARKEREEQERVEQEKEERKRREEKEKMDREKAERAIRGGVRGVRGRRGSVSTSAASIARGKDTTSSRGATAGKPRSSVPKRPQSSASSTAGVSSGIPRMSYRPS